MGMEGLLWMSRMKSHGKYSEESPKQFGVRDPVAVHYRELKLPEADAATPPRPTCSHKHRLKGLGSTPRPRNRCYRCRRTAHPRARTKPKGFGQNHGGSPAATTPLPEYRLQLVSQFPSMPRQLPRILLNRDRSLELLPPFYLEDRLRPYMRGPGIGRCWARRTALQSITFLFFLDGSLGFWQNDDGMP